MNESAGNGQIPVGDAIGIARDLLEQMVGKSPESVSGVNRSENGWTISLDVVELARIPPSTDLLASYDVSLDSRGDLVELTRARRYLRNQSDEE